MRDKKWHWKKSRLGWVLVTSIITIQACGGPAPPTDDTASASLGEAPSNITAETLRNHVARLSDDEMEGRSPGSAGTRLARQYLAEAMASYGLDPAFDGQWEQTFDLVGITSQAPETWKFEGAGQSLELEFYKEFIASSGVQAETSQIDNADLVFVGYGIQAPEYGWDDYKGADLAGKVLVMLNNDPDWDASLFEGDKRLYYGRWDYKYEIAAAKGAAAAIIIHTTSSAGYPWQVVQTGWTGAQFELPAGDESRIQIASWVTEEAARRLAALAGQDLDALLASAKSTEFEPVNLGLVTSLSLSNTLEEVDGANVGGLLPGSDPALQDQVVVFSAHHDHMGIGEPNADGDDVYNGARDNASGSAAVLAIAEAFAQQPTAPARSLLFLFVDGEEQGLLGSEYFAQNPIVEPGRIAANINIDGANIWGRARDIALVGFGKSSLDAVVQQIAEAQGRVVKPEQFPDKGHFYRSDQFNFAKIGVPAIYTDNGVDFVDRPSGWGKDEIDTWVETHYHQPSDELNDSWNFDGFVEDTLLHYEAGRIIAESAELPAWHAGDEFEATRLEALAELE